MLPKHILVPTDLSEQSEQALDYACELARTLGATVHVLHVVGIPALGVPELGLTMTSTMIDTIVADDQAALDALVARKRGLALIGQVLLRTGDARDMIDHAASELGADLIVMGSHGRRGVSRALLGSVAESVVRTAPCPVLCVRERHDHQAGRSAA